jgi:hypothetical protein
VDHGVPRIEPHRSLDERDGGFGAAILVEHPRVGLVSVQVSWPPANLLRGHAEGAPKVNVPVKQEVGLLHVHDLAHVARPGECTTDSVQREVSGARVALNSASRATEAS